MSFTRSALDTSCVLPRSGNGGLCTRADTLLVGFTGAQIGDRGDIIVVDDDNDDDVVDRGVEQIPLRGDDNDSGSGCGGSGIALNISSGDDNTGDENCYKRG